MKTAWLILLATLLGPAADFHDLQDAESSNLIVSTSIVDDIDVDDSIRVSLTNRSSEPIRIWHPKTRRGFYAVSLRLVDVATGKAIDVKKREIADEKFWIALEEGMEPGREVITIKPNGRYTFIFDLNGFSWGSRTWTGLPGPNSGIKHSCVIQFESKFDRQRPEIWAGKAAAKQTTVTISSQWNKTPHDLLRNHYPDQALRMMIADPKWIDHMDSDQRTPLHIASRVGQLDVVNWLLENGADINAKAHTGRTPLHHASDLKVIEAILKKGPDLNSRPRGRGQTPLQDAVTNLSSARTRMEKAKWKRIVELYLNYEADFDIMTAIHLGDMTRIKAILKEAPELADGYHGQSPLRIAASIGNLEVCELLLNNFDVDVDDFDRGIGYPIIKGALKYPEVVRLLIKHGADLRKRITWQGGRSGIWIIGDDATCLHYAADDGVPETVKILIDAGVDIFAAAHPILSDEEEKQTALEVAAFFGKTDNAVAMLEHPKFAATAKKTQHDTLLKSLRAGVSTSWLAREPQNRLKLVEAIIAKADDLGLSDTGSEIIQLAVNGIHASEQETNQQIKKMVAVLRKHGAKLDVYSAVAIRDVHELKSLLAKDPKLADSYSAGGYPALHKAIGMNYPEVVKILLEAGANIEIPNQSESTGSKGGTPLECVAFWGHLEIAKLLIRAGASVNATDETGFTLLHEAARLDNIRIARLLLENGADVSIKDNEGKTPLDWSDDKEEFRQLFSEFAHKPSNH